MIPIPVVGDIDLTCRHLLVPDTDLRVVLCMAEPGSESAARLARLLHTPARVESMR